MNKTYIVLSIIGMIFIFIVIAVLGNKAINNNIENNVNDIAEIEETLKEINLSNSDYIDDSFSDFGANLNEEIATTKITEEDKQKTINEINSALLDTDKTSYDENAGLDINFGNL